MRPEYKVCGGTFLYVVLLALSAKARRRGLNNEGIKESTCFMDMIKLGMKQDIIETKEPSHKKPQNTNTARLSLRLGCLLLQKVT